MLGWYKTLAALLFCCNGFEADPDLLRGETNGFARVFEVSFSFLRFAVSGDDIVVHMFDLQLDVLREDAFVGR